MATTKTDIINMKAAADLSALQGRLLKVTAAQTVGVASVIGEMCIGVLSNKPKLGDAAAIDIGPLVEVVAGATIAAGQKVSANASGQAIVAVATHHVLGIATEAAISGGKFQLFFHPMGILA